MSGSITDQARIHLREGVDAGLADGRKRAVHAVAREVRITPRRLLAILHGEVQRIWADEHEAIQLWHRSFLEREAVRAERRADTLRVRRELLDARDESLRE